MIRLREGLGFETVGDIRVFLREDGLTGSERKEIRFWAGSADEGPESDLFDGLRVKAPGLKLLPGLLPRLGARPGQVCLEVGAGQGWASLVLKRAVPGVSVHVSELSAAALLSAAKWEGLMGVRLDGKWACSSRDLPFADGQFDLLFTYEAFHHLGVAGDFSAALGEMVRVRKPGGRIVLLREPSAPAYLRRWQRRRVNRMRQVRLHADVDEDVLVLARLERDVRALGLVCDVAFDTDWAFQDVSLAGVLRSALVRACPPLGRLVPCGVHVTIAAPGAGGTGA